MSWIRDRLLYATTIACSATLLFAIQPIVAKALLPRFGGSAGVWITSVLFFQLTLLLGYGYAYLAARHLNPRVQPALHVALLAISAFLLPWGLPTAASTPASGNPVLSILSILATWIGLPFFLLSTTSPLVQSWYSRSSEARFPYRLFALSNAASLLALVSYPVAVEPALTEGHQLQAWSAAYLVFACLCAVSAFRQRLHQTASSIAGNGLTAAETKSGPASPFLWIALAACAATLWPAIANHLSQEVAAIPFLWVLPLGLYLLSFILCFESDSWYRPALFRFLLPAAWVAISSRLALQGSAGGLQWDIPIFAASLFVCCMFCHGELARLKPAPGHDLPFFYLMVALGGALGAIFVGLVAPNIFSSYLELPIGVAASIILSLPLLYRRGSPRQLARIALVSIAAFIAATRLAGGAQDFLRIRNFYGALQVIDAGTGDSAIRKLYNGKTLHGIQFTSPARSRQASAYYGPESGIALALESMRTPNRRVAIVGLGAGTLATFGRPGDTFRFYDINPAVIQVAENDFRFLRESAAQISVIAADGRLGIAREPAKSFHLIVLDAFSGDSIPVHLLTREAFQMYLERLADGGILAIHATNRYLDLVSLVQAQAAGLGKRITVIHNGSDPERYIYPADWALISSQQPGNSPKPKLRVWTDDYSNLFQLLK